jgi:hypothetical protein
MNTFATAISAATLALAASAAYAWGWPPLGYASNEGWDVSETGEGSGTLFKGNGYPNYGYGYMPYGYGAPLPPALELTDEQKQAVADQQARAAKYFRALQEQAAEFYANNPNPVFEMQRAMFEERNAHIQEMNEFLREMQEDMARNVQESMQYRSYDPGHPVHMDRESRRQEIQARIAESRKAAAERSQAVEERIEALRKDHAARIEQREKERPGV